MTVLEPHAGDGALAMAAAEIVGRDLVTCYELMPRNVNKLRTMGFRIEVPTDFLQVVPEPKFDRVILNPPFSKMRDVAHIL
jgi:predicted RNA methylase